MKEKAIGKKDVLNLIYRLLYAIPAAIAIFGQVRPALSAWMENEASTENGISSLLQGAIYAGSIILSLLSAYVVSMIVTLSRQTKLVMLVLIILAFTGMMIFRIRPERLTVSGVLVLVPVIAADIIRERAGKESNGVVFLSPFFLAAFLFVQFVPISEKPVDWSGVERFFERVSEESKRFFEKFNFGTLDYENARIGFDGGGGLFGNLKGIDDEVMNVSARFNGAGATYLAGKVFSDFNGREWEISDKKEGLDRMIDTIETLSAIYETYPYNVNEVCAASDMEILIKDMKTEYIFAPSKMVIGSVGTQSAMSVGDNIFFTEKQRYGFKYNVRSYILNRNGEDLIKYHREISPEIWNSTAGKYKSADGHVYSYEELLNYRKLVKEVYMKKPDNSPEVSELIRGITEGYITCDPESGRIIRSSSEAGAAYMSVESDDVITTAGNEAHDPKIEISTNSNEANESGNEAYDPKNEISTNGNEANKHGNDAREKGYEDYKKLRRIEEYLKAHEYRTEIDGYRNDIGSAEEFLEYFLLENTSGYCSYYATAFVLMARSAGIPARYIQGFRIAQNSYNAVRVFAYNAHSWPEAYIEGVGWIRFEPTPGFKQVASWGEELAEPEYYEALKAEKDRQAAGMIAEPSVISDIEPGQNMIDESKLLEEQERIKAREARRRRVIITVAVIVVGTIVLMMILFVLISLLIREILFRKKKGEKQVLALCDRCFSVLECMGAKPQQGETLSEFAVRISAGSDQRRTGIAKGFYDSDLQFIAIYEKMIYGRPETEEKGDFHAEEKGDFHTEEKKDFHTGEKGDIHVEGKGDLHAEEKEDFHTGEKGDLHAEEKERFIAKEELLRDNYRMLKNRLLKEGGVKAVARYIWILVSGAENVFI